MTPPSTATTGADHTLPPGSDRNGSAPTSRDEKRHRSQQAILSAAREQFAAHGFERTTIRTVAADAGVDPALVMQRFGSKQGLFAAAARWDDDAALLGAGAAELPRAALEDLFARFEDAETREATVAVMRSCLTHPLAAAVMRDDVMCDRAAAVTATLEGPDAELRAGVFGAVVMGLALTRYLLEVEPVHSADREALRRVVEPVLRLLVDGSAQD